MLMCSMAFTDFMKPQMKYYGMYKFNDDAYCTFVGILAFISSAVSKFGIGVIQDYLGFVKVYFITLLLQTFLCFSINNVATSKLSFAIYMTFVFVCEGAHFVIFPAVSSAIYGSK